MEITRMGLTLASLWLVVATGLAEPVAVVSCETGVHPVSGVRLARGKLALPSEGFWRLENPSADHGPVSQVYLVMPPEVVRQTAGRRVAGIEERRLLSQGSNAIRQLWWPAMEFARQHAGQGPATVEEAVGTHDYEWVANSLKCCPYGDERGAQPPFVAIVPRAKFEFPADSTPQNRYAPPTNRQVLAVELTPIYDDGQHWVLWTNGNVERVAVDKELLKTLGVELRPILPAPAPGDAPMPATTEYTVVALVREAQGTATLQLVDTSGAKLEVQWHLGDAKPGDAKSMGNDWARQRLFAWQWLAHDADAPVLRHWMAIEKGQYGVEPPEFGEAGQNRADHEADWFNVLGGRAAMQETFQVDQLPGTGAAAGAATVAIATIPGVEAKSHPFEKMLAGQPGGRLTLAEAVPANRLFFYSAKPALLIPMLKDGAAFLQRTGSMAAGRLLVYDLQDRYLARLGMTRPWVEQLLASGLVTELAVTAPDLFFVDGTDLTVVARAPNLAALAPVLSVVGIKGVGGAPTSVPAGPRQAWWAASGDLLVAGTCQADVQAVLDLHAAGGAGSLGRSAEFRYMLTQLPVQATTRAYVYFSDPFIRRLIGPEVKIGQLRRVVAKTQLEAATAAALLWRLDGHAEPPALPALIEHGYVPAARQAANLTLDDRQVATSATWGTLADLKTLAQVPTTQATQAEADAYKRYVDAYSRYWRQFFDPVAVRLDDTPAGELEVTTFILPLLDSSIYNGLRRVLATRENAAPMRIPQLDPAPVALFSLNLSEEMWMKFLDDFMRHGAGAGGAPGMDALDDLGPGFHFAVHDSDPVIAFGSGEMLGLGTRVGRMNNEMLAIPLFVSFLTRPSSIIIELKRIEGMREFLRRGMVARLLPFGSERNVRTSYYRLDDEDAWIYAVEFFGINLRFRFEIKDNFLIVSNLPWQRRSAITALRPAMLNGLEACVEPASAVIQLPAMYTAAAERERRQAFEGIGYLAPLVTSGTPLAEAVARHAELFGFRPVHPTGGEWTPDDQGLRSTLYGTPGDARQPEYSPGKTDFGLLRDVRSLRVGLQFEDTGLRTCIRWTYGK